MKIAGTVAEGDEVAGFRVIHFPGHAPGLIGLWRESDRLALVSDTIYLLDSARMGNRCPRARRACPTPPGPGITPRRRSRFASWRRSSREVVGAGHNEPLRGDSLRPALERAAEKY